MKIAASIFKTLFLCLCIIANTHLAYAQTASILPQGKTQFLDNNGKPLTSGTVDFYIPSTTTRKTTWQNSAETVANSNPVVLDAGGRAIIYGDGSYRQVVKDRLGNVIWDQVTSSTGSGSGGSTATGDGDLVGTIKPWAGMTAPNQYVFTYGQEISRTTYSALFTAITSSQSVFCTSGSPTLTGLSDTTNFWVGASVEVSCLAAGFSTIISKTSSSITLASNANVSTNVTAIIFPWGRGNGTTTFNVPDFRGIVPTGNNNMGGVASSNLTTTYFGSTNPNSIGALSTFNIGGGHSLTLAELPTGITSTTTQSISVGKGSNNGIVVLAGGFINYTVNAGTAQVLEAGSGSNSLDVLNTLSGSNTINVTSNNTTGTTHSIVQPSRTTNYIIKVTPDANSATASGVTSLGSMTGDIACGAGLLCTGNTISAQQSLIVGSTPVVGGVSTGFLFNNAGVLGNSTTMTGTAYSFPNAGISIGGATNLIALDITGRIHATQATFSNGSVTTSQPLQVDFIPNNATIALGQFNVGSAIAPYVPGVSNQAFILTEYVTPPNSGTATGSGVDIRLYGTVSGGASVVGQSINTQTTAASTGGNQVGQYVGATAGATAGGGDHFAQNVLMNVGTGLAATSTVHVTEFDMNNGSSTAAKLGLVLNFGTGASDVGTCTGTYTLSNGGGTTPSCMGFMMQAGATSAGVANGIAIIGQTGGAWPLTATGTGILMAGGTADIGIDLSRNTTWTTAAFKSPGFLLNGSGNITTGGWQGSVIAGQYGGTGVANTGKTITLGGNLTTSGAFASTFTMTNTTSVTFPTSGTLATTSAANIPLTALATQATNTIVGNATAGSASPTALAIGSCSTASSALIWTTNTGFGCNTSITANAVPAANLTGTTLAAGVTASSLTSVGTLASLTVTGAGTFSGFFTVNNGLQQIWNTTTSGHDLWFINDTDTSGRNWNLGPRAGTGSPDLFAVYSPTSGVITTFNGSTAQVNTRGTTASTSTTTGSLINGGGFGNVGAGYFGAELSTATKYQIGAKLAWSATAPTISSGFCTSPSISNNNGTAAFTITIGSACAASTGVLTLPSASVGWACSFNNLTNPASSTPSQTASTTTSVSVTNYVRTTGVAGNWTASDVINVHCTAY